MNYKLFKLRHGRGLWTISLSWNDENPSFAIAIKPPTSHRSHIVYASKNFLRFVNGFTPIVWVIRFVQSEKILKVTNDDCIIRRGRIFLYDVFVHLYVVCVLNTPGT